MEYQDKAAYIATLVRDAKHAQGLSHTQLADLMGTGTVMTQKIMNGKSNITLATIVKIEQALGITIIPT